MLNSIFKKTVIISLVGHLSMFGIFSFSFGARLPAVNYGNVSFWGPILKPYDFLSKSNLGGRALKKAIFGQPKIYPVVKEINDRELIFSNYLKPCAGIGIVNDKSIFITKLIGQDYSLKRKKSVVMFYPSLPYNFSLYFKDRQVAHIGLEYSTSSRNKINYLEVRRVVSSGNLEADLLCMRYISHYLTIKKDASIGLDKWQKVKIELELKK